MLQLKMLENALKPKVTATANAKKHFSWGLGRNRDENGQKNSICCLKVALIRIVSIQRVKKDKAASDGRPGLLLLQSEEKALRKKLRENCSAKQWNG